MAAVVSATVSELVPLEVSPVSTGATGNVTGAESAGGAGAGGCGCAGGLGFEGGTTTAGMPGAGPGTGVAVLVNHCQGRSHFPVL